MLPPCRTVEICTWHMPRRGFWGNAHAAEPWYAAEAYKRQGRGAPRLLESTPMHKRRRGRLRRALPCSQVGFYCPVYYGPGIQVPGFHLHYISKDRARGGHVLQLSLESGTAQIIEVRRAAFGAPRRQGRVAAGRHGACAATPAVARTYQLLLLKTNIAPSQASQSLHAPSLPQIHRSIVDLPSSDAFMHHDLNLERARSELHAAEQDHS